MQRHQFFVDGTSGRGVALESGLAQIGHFARSDVGGDGNVALAAEQDELDRRRIIAGKNDEVLAYAINDRLGTHQVASGFLDTDDVRHGGQADHGLGLHVAGGAAGHVIENLRDVDRFGDVLEVQIQAFLGRLVVVRHDQQAGIGAGFLGVTGQFDGFAGRVGAGTGDHRNAAIDLLDHGTDDCDVLVDVEGCRFAGGADGDNGMGAVFKVEVHEFAEAVPVKTPLCIHGSDQCHHTARNHETAPAGKREP
ncbi:hypothetical protein D3C86_788760 [compost metagenome]